MKKFTIASTAIILALSVSMAQAATFENKNAAPANPHAQQNAQIQKQAVALTEVKTNHLNQKEINPLFKAAGDYQVGTGTGYSIQTQR